MAPSRLAEGVRHAEVEDLHLLALGDELAGGLQARCTTPSAWAWARPPATSSATRRASAEGSGPASSQLLQSLAAQQFEDQVGTVWALPHVADGQLVGLGEPGQRLDLAGLLGLCHAGGAGLDHLQGHGAEELAFPGLIHHAETAAVKTKTLICKTQILI